MSHNFKPPASIDPQDRRDDRMVKVMATQILDQAMLDKLLAGSTGEMREAMLERLIPYLGFTPNPLVSSDCPACGMRRGSVIAHACVGAS
jgi:hypothetical protein